MLGRLASTHLVQVSPVQRLQPCDFVFPLVFGYLVAPAQEVHEALNHGAMCDCVSQEECHIRTSHFQHVQELTILLVPAIKLGKDPPQLSVLLLVPPPSRLTRKLPDRHNVELPI